MKLNYHNFIQIFKKYPQGLFLSILHKQLFPNDFKEKHGTFFNTHYLQLYRYINSYPDFYNIYRIDGLLYVEPTLLFFDLIQDFVKFQLDKPGLYDLPKRAHYLRIESIKTMKSINILNPDIIGSVIQNFKDYIYEIKNKSLCFIRTHPRLLYDVTLILPYVTRFTSDSKKVELLNKFESVLESATRIHNKAVFLTLTTDPKRFSNLWEANRHFSKAWNKFLSYLTRRKQKRPEYIACYEYTKKTGLLHMHVILFGMQWLASHQSITEEWGRCGQGEINWEYQIYNDNGKWNWLHKHPRSDYDSDAGNYLKKYLKKALFSDNHLELYWTFNKRFMTCSRRFIDHTHEATTTGIIWKFIGSFRRNDIPDNVFLSQVSFKNSGNGG